MSKKNYKSAIDNIQFSGNLNEKILDYLASNSSLSEKEASSKKVKKQKLYIPFAAAMFALVLVLSIPLFKNISNKIKGNGDKKIIVNGSIMEMRNLNELKRFSDTIVEVEGTKEYKIIDYNGIPSRLSTVKVKEVFKGDKNLKELKIIQVENLDVPPKNKQKLLMFLHTDRDNLQDHPYGVIGAGQGIYLIENDTNTQHKVLKPQAIRNDALLQELSGNYEDVKNKLKD